MLMPRILATLLWPLAVVVAFAVCAMWIVDTQSGKIGAWALIAFFWGAALVAVAVHYLSQRADVLTRYLAHHRPLAGPRPGAELPE